MTDRCPITWTPWRHQSSLVMIPNLYEVLLSLINTRPHQSNLSARGDRKIKRTKAGLTEETSSGGEIRKMGSRFSEFWDLIGPQSSDLIGLISDLRIWSDCSQLISVGQSAEYDNHDNFKPDTTSKVPLQGAQINPWWHISTISFDQLPDLHFLIIGSVGFFFVG